MRRSIALALTLLLPLSSAQAVPQVLNFQGRLSESGLPAAGSRSITFRVYAAAAGGSALFTETTTVAVSSGVFSVLIGDATPGGVPLSVFDGGDRWVEVQVGTTVLPRQRMASVGQAFFAEQARSLASGATVQVHTIVVSSVTTDALRVLDVVKIGTGTITMGGTPVNGGAANSITFSGLGAGPTAGLGGLIRTAGGGGGPGPLQLETGGNNSIFLAPGGAGLVSLTSSLELTGGAAKTISAPAAAQLTVQTGGANPLKLNPAAGSGNVGIGLADPLLPADKLHLVGRLRLDNDPVNDANTGCFGYNGTQLEFSNDCVTFQPFATGGLSGSGTADRIPKFVNSTTLGDSQLFTDPADGSVGIFGAPQALAGLPHLDIFGSPLPLSPAVKWLSMRLLDTDIATFEIDSRNTSQFRMATPSSFFQIDANNDPSTLTLAHHANPANGGNISVSYSAPTRIRFAQSATIQTFSLVLQGDPPDPTQTRLGIGTSNPLAKLDIGGTPGVDGIRFPDGTLQTTAGNGWADGGASVSLTDPNDNVGVGTTSPPTEKLEVVGNVKATAFIGDGSQLTGISAGAAGANTGSGADGAYTAAAGVPLAPGEYHFTSFTVPAGVPLTVSGLAIVRVSGSVAIQGNVTVNQVLVGGNVNLGGAFGLEAGGDGKGIGAGCGANNSNGDGGGGGNGGRGGGGEWSCGGAAYPWRLQPYGSSGGAGQMTTSGSASRGGSGGGGLVIVAQGAVNISGQILADGGVGGAASNGGGGGSGGTVAIFSETSIANTGPAIRARGGNGGSGNGGGGGGGQIIMVAPAVSQGITDVAGGVAAGSAGNAAAGAIGRVIIRQTPPGPWAL